MNQEHIDRKTGFAAMITLFIVSGLILIITSSISTIMSAKKQISRNMVKSMQSYYSAESGIEDALLRVIKNYEYSAMNSFVLDGADIDQSITQDGNTSTIESAASYSNNERKVRTSLAITTDNISFHYGVQVGVGGLEMANNSTINGNLYSDGSIVGGGNDSEITGDTYVATGMTLDRSWTVYNNDRVFGDAEPVIDVAQSFSTTVTAKLSQVAFYIKKYGNPSDKTIRVVADNAGSPSKTELASTTLVASKIGNSYGWVNYSFSSPPTLTAGTTYWVIVDTSQSSSKYFSIGKDSNNGNGNGVSKHSSDWNAGSPVWTQDSGDFNFKVWMGGVATSLANVVVGGDAHANTIINSKICGNAYYQSIDAGSTTFLNSPTNPTCALPLTDGTGIPDSEDPAVQALPISASNIADWKADALEGGTFSDAAHCTPNTDIVLGPAKLACSFAPSGGIKIIIAGTVWVDGNITLQNGDVLELAEGYGANSGEILADKESSPSTGGIIVTDPNVHICGSAGYNEGTNTCNPSNGSYVLLLSTHSGTTTDAITISNNADGAIFYASNGSAKVAQHANLKEVTAYKLELEENASVTYESGLASASFSSGPGGGWKINSWNEVQ